jgi:hypothetical protein
MLSSSTNNSNFSYKVFAYFFIIAILLYIYHRVDLASTDPKAFTKNFMTHFVYIIIPLIAVFGLLMALTFDPKFTMFLFFTALFVVILFYSFFYFLKTNLSQYIFNKYLLYIVIAAIFIVGASILVTIFSGTLRKMTGWTGFIFNLLFYIPCLIRDGIQAVAREYQTFSNTMVILFVIEVILVMTYFFLIPFVNNQIFPSHTKLLEEPRMLNTEFALKMPQDISNNFAVSMWFYVNPGSINKPSYSVETPIFSYLDASGNKHIQLSYSNIEQGNNDFIMYVGETPYPMSLPLQKWNNVVYNYVTYEDSAVHPSTSSPRESESTFRKWFKALFPKQILPTTLQNLISTPTPTSTPNNTNIKKTTVDMFVNGILERSHTYDESIPVFSIEDTIAIGNGKMDYSTIDTGEDGVEGANSHNSNRDGLYGSICNIVYYNKPLTKMAIVYNFNLLTIQNPPV